MALDEKGVAYTHEPAMPQSPEQLARHPWGKIPSMTHGDVALFESLAITRYIDEAFEGPALQPADAADRARMDQWISAFIDYMYAPIVRNIIIQRVVVETPDEAVIAAAVPDAAKSIGLLNDQLAATPYLAGSTMSLADLFVLPAINYVAMVPEGGPLLETGRQRHRLGPPACNRATAPRSHWPHRRRIRQAQNAALDFQAPRFRGARQILVGIRHSWQRLAKAGAERLSRTSIWASWSRECGMSRSRPTGTKTAGSTIPRR